MFLHLSKHKDKWILCFVEVWVRQISTAGYKLLSFLERTWKVTPFQQLPQPGDKVYAGRSRIYLFKEKLKRRREITHKTRLKGLVLLTHPEVIFLSIFLGTKARGHDSGLDSLFLMRRVWVSWGFPQFHRPNWCQTTFHTSWSEHWCIPPSKIPFLPLRILHCESGTELFTWVF